jgi:hypothetical protein
MRARRRKTRYASKMEERYALDLQLRKVAGEVASWEYEPETYPLTVNGVTVTHYTPDFRVHFSDGHSEIHEVKGFWRPDAKLRVKLFLALHPGVTFRVYGAPMDKRRRSSDGPR